MNYPKPDNLDEAGKVYEVSYISIPQYGKRQKIIAGPRTGIFGNIEPNLKAGLLIGIGIIGAVAIGAYLLSKNRKENR